MKNIIILLVLSLAVSLIGNIYQYSIANKNIQESYLKGSNDFKRKINVANEDLKSNLIAKLIEKFDYEYYYGLEKSFKSTRSENDLFIYTLVVANKWQDPNVIFDVFKIIATLDPSNKFQDVPDLDFLDAETRQMALEYLVNSAELGCPDGKFILGKYYLEGKYFEKKIMLGTKLIEEANADTNNLYR